MRQAYFWPIYGEDNEVVFHYAASRAHEHVARFLGTHFNGTLLSDGYDAYARYAEKNSAVTHAGCWAHSRRHFEQAREAEPHATSEALALIGRLYQHEQEIRNRQLLGEQTPNEADPNGDRYAFEKGCLGQRRGWLRRRLDGPAFRLGVQGQAQGS